MVMVTDPHFAFLFMRLFAVSPIELFLNILIFISVAALLFLKGHRLYLFSVQWPLLFVSLTPLQLQCILANIAIADTFAE
jgi:hypothetical protein